MHYLIRDSKSYPSTRRWDLDSVLQFNTLDPKVLECCRLFRENTARWLEETCRSIPPLELPVPTQYSLDSQLPSHYIQVSLTPSS